jgi:hypothetical protein
MKISRTMIALVVLLVATPMLGMPARAENFDRNVIASARCVEASGSDSAQVEVTVTNESGLPITLSYVHGWTTGQAFNPTFLMKAPGRSPAYTIDDGDRFIAWAPWDDLRQNEGEVGMAVVVTSAGVLMPQCGNVATLVRPLGPNPTNGIEAITENATIAAETIGWLEAWRAYPALYALLHPDSQAKVSFNAVACWYADQYGIPTDWKNSVFSTQVLDVSIGPWTWGVTGKAYGNAAAISYTQKIGTMSKSAPVTGTEHLVSDQGDGQFRWFFGLSKEEIAAQPTNCDLGN